MRRLFAVAGVLAVCGCTCQKPGPVDAGVPGPAPLVKTAEREPNETFEQAQPIAVPGVIEAQLGADPARPDVDTFKLTSPGTGFFSVTVTSPPDADVVLEILDEGGNPLSRLNAQGASAPEVLPALVIAGQRAIRVSSAVRGRGGAYSVTVEKVSMPAGAEEEPNDRAADATSGTLGSSSSGLLAGPADEDWYRYEFRPAEPTDAPVAVDGGAAPSDAGEGHDGGDSAPDAGAPLITARPLRIEVSPVPGVRLRVRVMTEAMAVLFEADSAEGAGLLLRNVGVREVDRVIYVVVSPVPADAARKPAVPATFNASDRYSLSVADEEAGATGEVEPNNDVARATPLRADSYRDAFLSPAEDADYFRVDVAQKSLIDVNVNGLPGVDLQLALVELPTDGGAPRDVLKANEGGTKEPERLLNVSCLATCFFKVEGVGKKVGKEWVKSGSSAEVPYRIAASVRPDDGEFEREPNDTPATATPLALGKKARGTVYPKKDVDDFLLDLGERPVKTPIRATLTGILKVDVALYLYRLDDDGAKTLIQTADRGKNDAPESLQASLDPGRYVFEVKDTKNRESNFQDAYQLTVEEAAEE